MLYVVRQAKHLMSQKKQRDRDVAELRSGHTDLILDPLVKLMPASHYDYWCVFLGFRFNLSCCGGHELWREICI